MVDVFVCVVCVLITMYVITVVASALYFKWGYFAFFYHDVMRWHRPEGNSVTFSGPSFIGKCKHCGKDIAQDSQGNWFEL